MTKFRESKITAAAFLFEWELTHQIGEYELSVVTTEGLQDADPSIIAMEIRDSLEEPESALCSEYRGGCFWALGKRCDKNLLEFYKQHLAKEVKRDMGVAYQIMIALENLGEMVWTERHRGFSLLDEEENRAVAEKYLAQGRR